MRTLIRWSKFNLIGAMGMGVQLAALAVLHHLLHGHLLWALVVAIELTLLHNFVWHTRYTWADRRDDTSRFRQFVRFHLSNGAVSLLGNLLLTPLLLQQARLPLLIANGVAILCCSIANFWLGNVWAFGRLDGSKTVTSNEHRLLTPSALILALLFLATPGRDHAQTQPQPPPHIDEGFGIDCAYENAFAGPAASMAGRSQTSFMAGFTFGQYSARNFGKRIQPSPQFEMGIIGPVQNGHPVDGFASVNYMVASKVKSHAVYPFLTGGYTRLFATGNATNFGVGFDFGKSGYKYIVRIELRDYYLFTSPKQSASSVRIGFGKFLPD